MRPVDVLKCAALTMIALWVLPCGAGEDPFKGAGNVVAPIATLPWRKQAPDLPQRITDLWGNRERDGGFGELVELPPGFKSPLHAHSGDFHGVLIKGAWVHEDANGNGPVDRCVSKEPCLLFLFQYSRADVIFPAKK
jgi:hypothetical protein